MCPLGPDSASMLRAGTVLVGGAEAPVCSWGRILDSASMLRAGTVLVGAELRHRVSLGPDSASVLRAGLQGSLGGSGGGGISSLLSIAAQRRHDRPIMASRSAANKTAQHRITLLKCTTTVIGYNYPV